MRNTNRKSKLGLAVLIFLVSRSSFALGGLMMGVFPYIGSGNSEATLEFSSRVEFDSATPPDEKECRKHIEKQLRFLAGPMQFGRMHGGAPQKAHQLEHVVCARKPGTGTFVATYDYRGTVAVADDAEDGFPVYLPIRPEAIYEQAESTSKNHSVDMCTDENYPSEDDFWYFWSPTRGGCRLSEGKHFVKSEGHLLRPTAPKRAYPEYSRLVDDQGVIRISVFFGIYINPTARNNNPMRSREVDAAEYRAFKNDLLYRKGFQWVRNQYERGTPYFAEEFMKTTPRAKIVVTIFYGPTRLDDPGSEHFHRFLADAARNSSVLIYNGHSDLGGALNFDEIQEQEHSADRIHLNRSRYQILMANGCSTYTHFSDMLFADKKTPQDPSGTRNLDLITNALEGFSNVNAMDSLALVGAVDSWATSHGMEDYQTILSQFARNTLPGVQGEQDNADPL